jgi:hypothetical protein
MRHLIPVLIATASLLTSTSAQSAAPAANELKRNPPRQGFGPPGAGPPAPPAQ